ncbi:hypothetical protein MMO38_00585 [Acinetobacter sp. NIPH 1852]|uniref:hypothetical protein n=1 Tax=Acinetobacter sp. NIPH 1852 TaxID=2923428 RepID=UPI001F4B5E9F|nr:hypothetical protein [Acinetobacter sp. NIPH 1852]MCH7306644.1 hypothetical protein [Acinetobacter sp. NIPH 1852]
MIRDTSKLIFLDKFSAITFFLIIIHQAIIALSIYFLTQLINHFQAQEPIYSDLILYLFCMLFPYLPGLLSYVCLQKWMNSVHKRYIEKLISLDIYTPIKLDAHDKKEVIDSISSRNSFSTINSYLYFIHDFATLLLNSIFSLLVISYLLPKELSLGYIASVVLSFIIILITHKKIYHLSKKSEISFIEYGSTLLKLWDNFSLKNKINKDLWLKEFNPISNNYYNSALRLQATKQLINLIIACAALLPTSYLILQLIINQQTQGIVIAAIIVNMTRIFTILSSLNSLLHACIEFPSLHARLSVLFSFKDFSPPKIQKDKKTKINQIEINNYDNFLLKIKVENSGRFTITGANGSGKSTLLAYIKDRLPNDSVLIPTSNHNILWGEHMNELSTGQKMLFILNKIRNIDEKIILLDEWDANLDEGNTRTINNLLDEISTSKIIIEIRHKTISL